MMTSLLSNILPFLALVVGFGFLIFVHELGHFLVAKWVGIRCTQFAIGFGQSMLTYRKGIGLRNGTTEAEYERRTRRLLRDEGVDLDGLSEPQQQLRIYEAGDRLGLGETEYRLNWMPLGGYVKMLGQEDMDPTARSDDPRAFNRKPVWARAAVISAGVTMNLIFGLLFFIIAFMAGVKFHPPIVGATVPGSPAAGAQAVGHADDPDFQGLQPGDRVLSIDGDPVTDFTDITVGTALARRDQALSIVVQRDDHPKPLTYRIKPVQAEQGGKLLFIGVIPPISLQITTAPNASAMIQVTELLYQAGIEPGDRVIEVDGQPVERFDQYAAAVEARRGEPVRVTFVDDKTPMLRHADIAARPQLIADSDTPANLLGLQPTLAVHAVLPDTPAAKAKLMPGDVIVEIAGLSWPSFTEALQQIGNSAGQKVTLSVLRDGQVVDLGSVTLHRTQGLGIMTDTSMALGRAVAGSPAAPLELTPGSRITAIADQPVQDWADMQRVLADVAAAHPDGASVPITFVRNVTGQPEGTAKLSFGPADAQALAAAEWMQPIILFDDLRVPVSASTPWAATKMGLHKTKQFMLQTYMTLLRLFQRTVPVQELRGPVGIFHIGTQTAQQGWTYLLFFLGLISVNLVVINFLPIPIVDGGLMVFLIIEKIKGSPVHPTVLAAANWVGLALIGTIMLTTLYFDISRLLPS